MSYLKLKSVDERTKGLVRNCNAHNLFHPKKRLYKSVWDLGRNYKKAWKHLCYPVHSIWTMSKFQRFPKTLDPEPA